MITLSTGKIKDLRIDSDVDYLIVSGDDSVYPEIMDKTWQSSLLRKVYFLKSQSSSKEELKDKVNSHSCSDFHWSWRRIINSTAEEGYEKKTFYFTVNNQPQGVLHAFFPKAARLAVGENLVYIDRIAVAPCNRSSASPQVFKGIGSLLMLFIKAFSQENGYGGAVGLHALKQAKDFYVYLGMQSLGVDTEYENLEYFESPKQLVANGEG